MGVSEVRDDVERLLKLGVSEVAKTWRGFERQRDEEDPAWSCDLRRPRLPGHIHRESGTVHGLIAVEQCPQTHRSFLGGEGVKRTAMLNKIHQAPLLATNPLPPETPPTPRIRPQLNITPSST